MHKLTCRLLGVAALAGAVAMLAAASSPLAMEFRLSSAAFANNQTIPRAHACDGDNTSPALRWDGAPPSTRSLALIVHDPDAPAGDFTHWLVYDLPATLSELPSGKYEGAQFPLGGLEGKNSFGNLGYGAPCPPAGPPHHYVFTIYALSAPKLGLAPGASQDDLLKAMQGKILAQATLVGLYQR